jgi:4'-phosphopantetheinyl transferase
VGEHVAALDQYSGEYLTDEERERLLRYRSRAAAERYVVTRSLVRLVLADRLGRAPRDVPVNRTDTGKPIVTGGVHFNVSHSGDLILLGVSDQRDIGVDVERRRSIPRVGALVRRWLDPVERDEVARLVRDGSTDSDAFLRVWSVKEARLKALGVGIGGQSRAGELGRVEVSALDALLNTIPTSDDEGYVGAVAFA